MNKNLKKIILASLFAAITTIGTMVIQVPTPTKGYIHIGDTIVYLAGIILGPVYGFLAAGFGSFLADVFSGYIIYAVPTFVIKGLDAAVVGLIYTKLSKNTKGWKLKILDFSIAVSMGTIIMVSGYYIYEAMLYGYKAALIGIPANIVQGIGGGMLAIPLVVALDKVGITREKFLEK